MGMSSYPCRYSQLWSSMYSFSSQSAGCQSSGSLIFFGGSRLQSLYKLPVCFSSLSMRILYVASGRMMKV
nr:hypothetical protein Iba_chr10dCG10980 [Ipomoea batatas]